MPEPQTAQQGVRCAKCGDEIYSNYTHDFRYCSCKATFVDGGWAYLRVGWEPEVGRPESISRPALPRLVRAATAPVLATVEDDSSV